MMIVARNLKLESNKSFFLLGPRKTGKSTYLKSLYPESVYYDLLETDLFVKYTKEPWLFRQELLLKVQDNSLLREQSVIVDEIQKVPLLLNEIHKLIEEEGLHFLLSGSSARKLRSQGVNLLGGRAGKIRFHPLTLFELADDYDLLKVLNRGKIPSIYLTDDYLSELESYTSLYLKEEIVQEGLTRNLSVFANFLKVAAFSQSEQVNYSNIGREVGIDNRTVKDYFQILEDTLIGNFIIPYKSGRGRKDLVSAPKFYFFDTGVANYLRGVNLLSIGGPQFGKSFEHLVYLELQAYLDYNRISKPISYWRTRKGLEVDFVLGEAEVAVEVKSGNMSNANFDGLLEFESEYKPKQSLIVANVSESRLLDNGLKVLSLGDFVEGLWAGELV